MKYTIAKARAKNPALIELTNINWVTYRHFSAGGGDVTIETHTRHE